MPTYTPPNTHTGKQKDTKHSTVECNKDGQIFKISDHKNANKSKNRLIPLKLYSKKHDKKSKGLAGGYWGGAIPSFVHRKNDVPYTI